MIGWIAIAFMWAGLIFGWNRPRSVPALLCWGAALPCLLIVGAWPLNIALCGVIVGVRLWGHGEAMTSIIARNWRKKRRERQEARSTVAAQQAVVDRLVISFLKPAHSLSCPEAPGIELPVVSITVEGKPDEVRRLRKALEAERDSEGSYGGSE